MTDTPRTKAAQAKKPPPKAKPSRKPRERAAHTYPSGLTPTMEANLAATIAMIRDYETMRKLFASGKTPISETTFFRCLDLDRVGTYREQYARAREMQADTMVDTIVDIADDAGGDVYLDKDGNPKIDHENVQRAKLRVDTRKWLVSKLSPKRYGDKIQMEVEHRLADATVDELLRRIEEVALVYGIIFPDGLLRLPEKPRGD